jgi:fructose-bisphosphate aldolase class I
MEETMDTKQFERMGRGKGFVAALDQSGGSTPKALAQYGIPESSYDGEEAMFDLVHRMRTRIIAGKEFTDRHILGAILFENTMERKIGDRFTGDYLWETKHIVPFLKIDKGMEAQRQGVQLMKPIPGLDALLDRAVARHMFGTKMRSVIKKADKDGIKAIVDQQFALASRIAAKGLVPIVEPEVDIHAPDKAEAERILKEELFSHLSSLPAETKVMCKLSIPTVDDFYADLMQDSHVLRVVALSGGYSRDEATRLLARNHGLIASFSRALAQGLSAGQTDEQFDAMLADSIRQIYEASVT